MYPVVTVNPVKSQLSRRALVLKTSTLKYALFSLCGLLLFLSLLSFPVSGAEEKTPPFYPEVDRKTKRPVGKPDAAAPEEEIAGVDAGTVRTEEYVVKEGDWIAKILREKGVLKDYNSLPQLLEVLRKLNASLQNINMIQPGEKIVILVKVLPSEEGQKAAGGAKQAPPASLRKLKSEPYRVKRGDILSRVAMRRYNLSVREFNGEYLKLFRKCNPSVEEPDHIMPGQVIRLPLYPPRFEETTGITPALRDLDKSPRKVAISLPGSIPLEVKTPSAPPPSPKPEAATAAAASIEPEQEPPPGRSDQQAALFVAEDMGGIISRMGEEWIDSGEHFIPLKSSGHINLKAESYPVIRLNKMTVIVDLQSALPDQMAKVIESSWGSYRVVRLSAKDSLRSALGKVLRTFNYPKIFRKGQPLKLGGAIPVSITGDWILIPPETASGKRPGFIVINLLQARSHGTPGPIKDYLKRLGVEIIEYPPVEERSGETDKAIVVERTKDPASLIRAVLNLTGHDFSTRQRIPAYESADNDFRFTVEADFYLKIRGRSYIIDLTGLDPEVIALLKDHGVSVLSLAREKEPINMVARTLRFLNVNFKPGPHSFLARPGSVTRNVELTLTGILFSAHNGDSVFVSPLNLPSEIGAFLAQRGYKVLVLS
jgi:hypothetical protein